MPKRSTQGAPAVYGEALMDYQDYLKIPELLNLQKPQSKPAHHDELLFIIIHQTYELWFKLILHELEVTLDELRANHLSRALHFMARIVAVMKLLVEQIHLLETMTPVEFLAFRDRLKPASGFQSVQFRKIEFIAGMRNASYLKFFEGRAASRKVLAEALRGPDLGRAFLGAARKTGLAIPSGFTPKAAHEDQKTIEAIARSLLPLYQDPHADSDLYQLAETLMDFDETFHLWRHHHVNVVERIIGSKIGTGGSSGVPYLRTTLPKRCFPWLWEVRTLLEVAPKQGSKK